MKKSLILQLANIVLQNHYFQMEDSRTRINQGIIGNFSFIRECRVTTANTINNLDMLTTLAVTTGEGDVTVYPLLRDAGRDFKASKTPPEPFNEVLRG
ncbi:hypothetical protein [Yersinia pekkanenii]|uniref:Uncharacterized protein n=1 Tax=Yersinia pekkanenii TaxID=1288385 RepID=A0ABM9U0L8_9GAMM|nr:hypothetical protein [Yersinia pekkanenii]CRY69154.1 Uncharacterised protein [Yersinia pekkanenii]